MTERGGFEFGARYRTVEEHIIVEMLLLVGFALENDRSAALRQVTDALDRWVARGLGVRPGPAGDRRFDPVEVMYFLKKTGLEHTDAFWAERCVETARGLVRALPSAASQLYQVEFRRCFFLEDVPLGKAVRVRAPLPLASAHGELLDLTTFIEGAPRAEVRATDGRLEGRFLAEGQHAITLGASFTLTGAQNRSPAAVSPMPHDYLKPVEGLIVVSSGVRRLAEKLAGDHSGIAALRLFWDYLMDELSCGPIHYDQLDPAAPCDWVLRSQHYDCQLGSALFIALCRARGIPARLVNGFFLYPQSPTNHYWAEAWLDDGGWTPFDCWTWDLAGGGRDSAWREHFFGRVDHRMVMQRLPYEFTGALGVPLPHTWHMLQLPQPQGVSVSFDGLDRRSIYRDVISVSHR